MELILLLITSGIPGFYTYYSLSNKNILYFESENKAIILSLFSALSILIFLAILSLFSYENNVNNLINNLTFTKIILSLIVSVIIAVVFTEIIFPICLEFYKDYNNKYRKNNNLSSNGTLPIHLKRYENEDEQIYVVIKNFDNTIIDDGIIKSYSKKDNRNLILQPLDEKYKNPVKSEGRLEKFIDFENQVILEYYFH